MTALTAVAAKAASLGPVIPLFDGENHEAVISAAISFVMNVIRPLERDTENKFAKYNYASVDKFMDMLRPLLVSAGLSITMTEIAYESKDVQASDDRGNVKARSLLFITFGFKISHASGAVIPGRDTWLKRTVAVPAGAAQAWGAAQSYALKQFCRATFMISTGERGIDADGDEPIAVEPGVPTIGMMTRVASQATVSVFLSDLDKATTAPEIETRFEKLKFEGKALHYDDKKAAMDGYLTALRRIDALTPPEKEPA